MTDYTNIIAYILLILIAGLVILSYFSHKEKVRRYFIDANNLLVTKFYFRLLLFSFSVLTFLFGIHDNLLNSRESEDNYSIILPPLLDNDNLTRENRFSKGGYLPPTDSIDKHTYSRVDYLIILDRTKSIKRKINKKLSKYCESRFSLKHKNALETFQKLDNEPDKILAALVHRMSLLNDLETIRFNIQIYNGDNKFKELLGGWQTLKINIGEEKELTEQIISILGELKGLDATEDSNTYFHEIYRNIKDNIYKDRHKTQNMNVIILSDFIHEFNKDEYTKQKLENAIDYLNLIDYKKLSLVELPSNSNSIDLKASNNSFEGINLFKTKKPNATRLYTWSHYDLDEFEDDKLSAFFKSILSMPPIETPIIKYDKNKITVQDLKEILGDCQYFGYEVKTTERKNSILSKFPTIKIADLDELKNKLANTNENEVVNLIFDTKNNSKEGVVEFIPSESIPKRSIRLFFFVRFLFLTTILAINYTYLRYIGHLNKLKSIDKKQLKKLGYEHLKNLDNNLIFTIRNGVRFAMVLILGLLVINLIPTHKVFNYIEWLYVLLMISILNVAPFYFYSFDKPSQNFLTDSK